MWNGFALVVIPGGNLTQTALLPKRAGGAEPGGDAVRAWGRMEYALVAIGQGKLPTHGTADRKLTVWWQSPSGIAARRRLQGVPT